MGGERADVQRHKDNLKMEGTFEGRLKEEALVGERVKAVKHSDNLRMEGSMDMKRDQGVVLPGERAQVTRHQDNLKMEGSMQLVSEAHSAGKAVQKVNYNTKKISKTAGGSSSTRKDVQSSIVIGDDTSSTTRAIAGHQAKRASSA